MESEVTPSLSFFKLVSWFEKNKKQAIWGAIILVAVVLFASLILWRQAQREEAASEELSKVTAPQLGARPEPAEAYLKVAAEYPKSGAAARALLLGAGSLFTEGKYDQAKAEFEKLLRDHKNSPFTSQAMLGVAACLDAQGKTNEAMSEYRRIGERYPNQNVAPQAKFALARLYEAQNKPSDALTLFEEVNRTAPGTSIG